MHRRLLLSHLAITLLVLLVLELPLGLFFADRERERLASAVERDATVLASIYEDALETGTPIDVRAAREYAAATGARVVVVDADAISLIDTEAPVPRDFSTRPEIASALDGFRSVGTRASETLAEDLLYVAVPSASGGVVHGAVRLTLPTSEVDRRIQRFWMSLVAVGAVVLLAVTAISWTISRSVVRPVRALTDAAERLAAGDLRARIDVGDAPRELAQLAGSFNGMADRLESLLGAQQAFVADASHQLRTPLTSLRLQLENAEAETADDRTRQDLRTAIGEVDRMTELVGQLLALARAEGRRVPSVPIDVTALAAERLELWEAVAGERGVGLILDAPGATPAAAAPGTVEQILDNLLDNAVGHAPPGSAVRIEVRVDGTGTVLRVVDHGTGMDAADKARAFERFWRGAADRAGTGLGLPIVRTLAEQSGGTASLEDTPGGGLTVVVRFPAQP
ncbi:MAG: ATP-binding protein [Acidimicrobiales bacterium]|nr:ATP-binding protein [Acidimicrobiales bacterium]